MGNSSRETIVAVATPPGKGGVGIVRLSGENIESIIAGIIGKTPKPRVASYRNFLDYDGSTIDQGIVLYFPSPYSFTGENVIELQGHGGPVVLDMIVNRALSLGARIARPGEFSERAFLNNKIDLTQAEAIADLIDSASQQAAKGALKSLQGEFSNRIKTLDIELVRLRMFVEAAIDFPEEEIDFLSDSKVIKNLSMVKSETLKVLEEAKQGALLREGVTLVLAGRPNVGKSSLMNLMSGRQSSIVTKVAGTTRDLINEDINVEGVPIRLVDTAGVRKAGTEVDEVEEIGISRAIEEMQKADGILLIVDLSVVSDWQAEVKTLLTDLPKHNNVVVILNKIDLMSSTVKEQRIRELTENAAINPYTVVMMSTLIGTGVGELKSVLKKTFSMTLTEEGTFIARSRHLHALNKALGHLESGTEQLLTYHAGDLLAEELRLCHECLCEITGEYSSDDLLGEIFSSFCIGK